MISHIAAATSAMQRHVLRRENIIEVTAASDRIDMRMFDQEKNIGNSLPLSKLDELFLP
jgi:hypothetical protein